MSDMADSTINEVIILGLVNNLMATDNARVTRMLDELIDVNDGRANMGWSPMAFRHGEIVYYHNKYQRGVIGPSSYMTPSLHKDLREQFDVIERERLILKEHTQKIKQILTVLLKGVRDRQMLRDLLPDCMSQYVIPHMERFMPQHLVWQLTDKQIREYQEILPLIQMYSASSILL